jgi:hypothetical protein
MTFRQTEHNGANAHRYITNTMALILRFKSSAKYRNSSAPATRPNARAR